MKEIKLSEISGSYLTSNTEVLTGKCHSQAKMHVKSSKLDVLQSDVVRNLAIEQSHIGILAIRKLSILNIKNSTITAIQDVAIGGGGPGEVSQIERTKVVTLRGLHILALANFSEVTMEMVRIQGSN